MTANPAAHLHTDSGPALNRISDEIMIAYGAPGALSFVTLIQGRRPKFVCVIATTETSLIPGISAAGTTAAGTMLTPAADAEFIVHGRAHCMAGVPSNPLGPPGPALITRATLELTGLTPLIVNAGCRVDPDAPTLDLHGRPGGLISEGDAVPNARDLYRAGERIGSHLAADSTYLVLGESVPGGTTTALALLLALGIESDGRVSSSIAGNAHALKSEVARSALAHLVPERVARDPLAAVEVLGDPMQPVVAGIVVGAWSIGIPVLLAGGTQMVAVLALLHALARAGQAPSRTPSMKGAVCVGTTRWVTEDPTADVSGLMSDLGHDPLIATPLSFAQSVHPQLRRYEDYLVKEGVGAGGLCVAAHLTENLASAKIAARVDTLYAEMADGQRGPRALPTPLPNPPPRGGRGSAERGDDRAS